MSVEDLFGTHFDESGLDALCMLEAIVDQYSGEATLHQMLLLMNRSDDGAVVVCSNDECKATCEVDCMPSGKAIPNAGAIQQAGRKCLRMARLRAQ